MPCWRNQEAGLLNAPVNAPAELTRLREGLCKEENFQSFQNSGGPKNWRVTEDRSALGSFAFLDTEQSSSVARPKESH